MAIEWNRNSVIEVYLKMEIALVVKLLLKEVNNDIDKIFTSGLCGERVRESIKKIEETVKELYYPENWWYEDEDEDEMMDVENELEYFNREVGYCREVRALAELEIDVEYLGLDYFIDIITDKSNVNIIASDDLEIDVEELDRDFKRHMRIEITGDIVECINNVQDNEYKKDILHIISRILFVDWISANITSDKIVLYVEYDLEALHYNMSGSTEVYSAYTIVFNIIILNAVQEYVKKVMSK